MNTAALVRLAAAGTVLGLGPATLAQQDAELPLSAVTLYRSGVAYFQRQGTIDGDADVELRFRTDQVNDILKSLVVLDLDGGTIASVAYASREPLERRLGSFGIDISDDPDLATLLDRHRGAALRIRTEAGEVIEGTVVGVEWRTTVVSQRDGVQEYRAWLMLLTETGLVSTPMDKVASFEVLDPELREALRRALAVIAEHRADRTKTIEIALRGDGPRQIAATYIHEAPVWKTSYRLVLPETDRRGSADAMLQGWAIVENTSDEDWNDVRLSLVAGRPISFQMDLYEPLYVDRPDVPVPTIPGVVSRAYGGGSSPFRDDVADAEAEAPADRSVMRRNAARPAPAAAAVPTESLAFGAARGRLSGEAMSKYAAASQARGAEIGEVFQYELGAPVTIQRQQSAMLPIITAPVSAERVSIFSPSDGTGLAMRGLRLTNSTDLQLLPGPISVYDGASYAGDAQIGHVPPGDDRLLAYAVDLELESSFEARDDSRVQSLKIVDGLIEQTFKREYVATYKFENKDTSDDRSVVVEHQRRNDWELERPDRAAETTPEVYRFDVEVSAGESESLTVVEQRIDMQRVAVLSYDLGTMVQHVRQGRASQAVLDALREAARRQADINRVQAAIAELDRERDAISQDQARIRENIRSIDRQSDLYTTYMTKLTNQEARLESLLEERERRTNELNRLQRDLSAYIASLDVE